jgi:hypothetical protein
MVQIDIPKAMLRMVGVLLLGIGLVSLLNLEPSYRTRTKRTAAGRQPREPSYREEYVNGKWLKNAVAAQTVADYTEQCPFVAEMAPFAQSDCHQTRAGGYSGFGASFDTGTALSFTVASVKRAFGGRTLAIFGDSLARQQFAALACSLMGIHRDGFMVATKYPRAGFWGGQTCIGFPGR